MLRVLRAYKYRIYPTKEQREFFEKTFGSCRFVWNKMLEEKLQALERGERLPRITPAKYKEEFPFLREVDSLALANVQLQQEQAFRNHFKNRKMFGIPKFKKKKDKQSFTTNNQNGTVMLIAEYLKIPKLKTLIRMKQHRTFEGTIKSVTISKTKTGKYYVSVLVEEEPKQDYNNNKKNLICGIDVGIISFATIATDTGIVKIEYPKYLIKNEKRLKRLQRQLSRKQRNSKNYEKARIVLAKKHEYIRNAREDFLHKLSKTIIDDNQVVVVEGLNIKGLTRTKLAKHILDNSWSKFISFLKYKADMYDVKVIEAGQFFPSSKTCSICGYINKELELKDRVWTCPKCGTTHDRDENAAINLREYGLDLYNQLVGMEQPELTPVETGPLPQGKSGR